MMSRRWKWKKAGSKDNEKTRKLVRGKYKCPNCGELGHRKNSPKCPLNSCKKRSMLISLHSFLLS
jgi:rubrerythrin